MSLYVEGTSDNQRSEFTMPTSAIIISIVAVILDILGVILLLVQTFDADFYY